MVYHTIILTFSKLNLKKLANKIEGITQPFVYVGKGKVISYEGEQPIKCKMELDSPIEINVYKEFIL